MAFFVLSFFPLDVLDEIWDLIESVSEGFFTYSYISAKIEAVKHLHAVFLQIVEQRRRPMRLEKAMVHFDGTDVV